MPRTQRISEHPILPIPDGKMINFNFNGKPFTARPGEVISSALFANGVNVFGHHYLDDSPQGIFCANGQCSQCMVIANGHAVKACMEPVIEGLNVFPLEGLPELSAQDDPVEDYSDAPELDCDVLIIGGGPAGIAAAIELGKLGHQVIMVDDKDRLGGKLVLQTHKFFGSIDDCYAGTRGIEIARILTEQVKKIDKVKVMLGTSAVGVFVDKKVGILQKGRYSLVKPKSSWWLRVPGNGPCHSPAVTFPEFTVPELSRPCSTVT